MNSKEFIEWKSTQDITHTGWYKKFGNKIDNARRKGLRVLLTFDEYLYKAFEAGLISHTQVTQTGYHLSRTNDEGDYLKDNCRFLPYVKNLQERRAIYGEDNILATISNDTARNIFIDNRSHVEIAKAFNCSERTVSRIKNRERWAHITKDL
ncbi:hypothetical protein [Ralstonia phage RP13]|nr:hypothetical protein [Ralstonia phage RP13]BCG50288.1 hypothetical protein [Ralstonia phage RP13]